MLNLRYVAVVIAVVVGAAACAGGSEQSEQAVTEPTVVAEPPAVTTPTTGIADPAPTAQPAATTEPTADPTPRAADAAGASVFEIVSTLASDELMGRDNQTQASAVAQDFLLDQLELISEPPVRDQGRAGYRFEYDAGINLIGIIPGTDLADEYLLVGAHYDHIGNTCRGTSSADDICNGAADNAAGVAAAIQVARTLADQQPRRSVIIALWDGEEDGLVGARQYVADPVIPLSQTVAYINFDIQGANLSPALSRTTVMIGAETGGQTLVDAALAATAPSPLDTASFSLIFGQGRSDHAPFAIAKVPVVFFTDATNGCYHTVDDDLDALDFTKLDLQIDNATRLAIDLTNTDTPPQFDSDASFTAFGDAVNLLRLVAASEPDFALLGPEGEIESAELLVALEEIVLAGPDAYVGQAANTVLGGAAQLVERLANGPCLPVPA